MRWIFTVLAAIEEFQAEHSPFGHKKLLPLISGLKAGDQQAFSMLYEATKEMIFNYVLCRFQGNRTYTEDVFPEIYTDAMQHTRNLAMDHNLRAWLIRIAKSKVADYFRNLERNKKLEDKESRRITLDSFIKQQDLNPEQAIVKEEEKILIRSALSQLPDKYRIIMIEKYIHDKKTEVIAQEKKQTVRAIESILYRGKKIFLEALKQTMASGGAHEK